METKNIFAMIDEIKSAWDKDQKSVNNSLRTAIIKDCWYSLSIVFQ